jgi:hypothetical protein
MRWGNWELIISKHPPVLRNNDWNEEVPLDASSGYFDIFNSILNVYTEDKYEKSRGLDLVQIEQLLEALETIHDHWFEKVEESMTFSEFEKEGSMTFSEAAYSYAASFKN